MKRSDDLVAELCRNHELMIFDGRQSLWSRAADEIVLLQDLLAERDLYIGAREREIEVLRGIVQRVKDGYRVGREQFRGWWVTGEVSDGVGNFPLGRSPMPEAQQRVLYGSVVREEEKS